MATLAVGLAACHERNRGDLDRLVTNGCLVRERLHTGRRSEGFLRNVYFTVSGNGKLWSRGLRTLVRVERIDCCNQAWVWRSTQNPHVRDLRWWSMLYVRLQILPLDEEIAIQKQRDHRDNEDQRTK